MKDYDSNRLAAIASANEIKKIFSISDGLADRYYCKMIDNIIDVLKSSTEKQYKDLTEYEWQQLMLKEFEKLPLEKIVRRYCIERKTFFNRPEDGSPSTTYINAPKKNTPISELEDIVETHSISGNGAIIVEADAFTFNDLINLAIVVRNNRVGNRQNKNKLRLVAGDKYYDDFLDAISICNFWIEYNFKEDNNHDN